MNWWMKSLIGVVGLLAAIQLVPYGREHTNPPVIEEPAWDSAQTRELAVAACFDCHSNETEWTWYSNIAPVSWVVANHVDEGRRILNFSEWNRQYRSTHEAVETVQEGSMPPLYYTAIHPEARLNQDQLDTLAAGLTATLGR